MRSMNKLPLAKRVQILTLLVEGSSMRTISRVVGVSINTVSKLLVDAGEACARFHYETVQNVKAQRVQCDEIWSFCYSKQANTPAGKRGARQHGMVTRGCAEAICHWAVHVRQRRSRHAARG